MRSWNLLKSSFARSVFALSVLAVAPSPARCAEATPMNIGVIGAGNIGGTLATLWVKSGHRVMLSSRHPDRLRELAERLGPLASVGTPAQAAAFGEVVLVAIPYGGYPELGRTLGGALAGKVVLDAGNPIPRRDGEVADEARTYGIVPTTMKYLGNARVVRAFTSLGSGVLAREANRPAPRLAIPLVGDDRDALEVASRLVRDAGFDPVVIGPGERAADTAVGGVLSGVQESATRMRRRLGLADPK